MAMPIRGHLDPDFFQIMEDVKNMLREVYHTANFMTLPISSTGTGAMETACANVLERGDTMVVCRNGYFGIRLADIAQRCGADVHVVDTPWGRPVDPQALDDELSRHPRVKAVGVVHAETSTGVLTSLPEIVDVVHRHGALAIVDAVTSLGGHDVRMGDGESTFATARPRSAWGRLPASPPSP